MQFEKNQILQTPRPKHFKKKKSSLFLEVFSKKQEIKTQLSKSRGNIF